MIDRRRAAAATAGIILAMGIASCGPAQQPRSQADGDVAANCSVSYAKTYDSPQEYIDDVKPDLIAKATFDAPRLSGNGRTVTFAAHLLDVKTGDAKSGDEMKLRFECDSVASFMPDGYHTGDEVIALANDGKLRQPESIWPFDQQTYDALTVQ